MRAGDGGKKRSLKFPPSLIGLAPICKVTRNLISKSQGCPKAVQQVGLTDPLQFICVQKTLILNAYDSRRIRETDLPDSLQVGEGLLD